MDELDREQYLTRRLPKVRTDRGPTAEWMAYLEDLHSRVADFPQAEESAVPKRDQSVLTVRTIKSMTKSRRSA